jgi:hypothetical protein
MALLCINSAILFFRDIALAFRVIHYSRKEEDRRCSQSKEKRIRRERASSLLFIRKGLASAGGLPVIIVITNHCPILNPGYNSYLCIYDLFGPVQKAFDVGKSITRASGRGLDLGNRDFFEPCEMALSRNNLEINSAV